MQVIHSILISALVTVLPWSLPEAAMGVPVNDADAVDDRAAATEQLRAELQTLQSWLQQKGGVGPDERRELEAFRTKVRAHLAEHPDDAVVLGLELQSSLWLSDNEAAEAAIARLLELRPEDDGLRLGWARHRVQQHRYEDALELVQQAPAGPDRRADAAAIEAQCLIAQHRFDQALATIESAQDATDGKPRVAVELARWRKTATEGQAVWEAELLAREQDSQLGDLPRVELETPRGVIVLELFEEQAPNTVANFISLAESDFYDGTLFHRVIPGFMAQGGDPLSRPGTPGQAGTGGPDYRIAGEQSREDRRNHFTGSIAMAHNGNPDNAGSQFYICFAPATHLNGKHAVFGRVIDGMDVLNATTANDEIVDVRVIRKRDHAYEPETLPPLPPPAPRTPPIEGLQGTIPIRR